MSTTVVPAPAAKATRPVRSNKLAKAAEKQQPAEKEEERVAQDDSEKEVSVAKAEAHENEAPASETSLAGDFSFDGALAEAAAASGSLVSEGTSGADYEVSFGQYDGDDDGSGGGTILLIGAILLVGLGIAALASGGGDDNDIPVPVNGNPTISTTGGPITINEDDTTGKTVTVTTSDPNGDTVTVTGSATKGTVTISGGTVTYKPNANANGTDTITLNAADGKGGTASTTVAVTITAVNDEPTITLDKTAETIDEDSTAGITIKATTADVDGDTVTTTGSATKGTVTKNADGTFKYVPNANANGSDTITIKADDGKGGSKSATVAVTINPIADPVTLTLDKTSASVDEDSAAGVTIVPTANDPDGNAVTVTATATNGTVTKNSDGSFKYVPKANFFGSDTVTVTADAGGGDTKTATVAITVNSVNDAPVAGPANTTAFSVEAGKSKTFSIDFSDADNDPLSATITGNPGKGTITTATNTYTANAGATGTDTFKVTVTDGKAPVEYTVTVTITAPANPTVSIDGVGTPEASATRSAADGNVIFTDTLAGTTNVFITNFTAGDRIQTNAPNGLGGYGFTTSADDPNDLRLTFNDGTQFNQIIIDDILPDGAVVFDYATARAAFGSEFMTFGS